MKVICVETDRDINYFLNSFQMICEHWSVKEVLENFRRHRRTENDKRIIIIDLDNAPEFKHSKPPENWYIIGLTSDAELKTEYTYSLINKLSSNENILNIIQEIADESCYRQLGHFPLYVGITRPELETPTGIVSLQLKEWRILRYLSQNQGRRVLGEELTYHIHDVGEADEMVDPHKVTQVYLTKLRKKFFLIVNSPVISYGTKTSGYYFLDFLSPDLEYIVNHHSNKEFIVVDKKTEEFVKDFYHKLTKLVAEKSLYELQHDEKLMCKHKRYSFLRNNLIIKDNFSLSKVILLLKKIRFPRIKKPMKRVENEQARRISYQ